MVQLLVQHDPAFTLLAVYWSGQHTTEPAIPFVRVVSLPACISPCVCHHT